MFRNVASTALVLIATGAMLSSGNTALAVITSEATGKGAIVFEDGFSSSLQFKAGVDALGNVYGEVQFLGHSPGGEENFRVHGTVTCYTLINDTTVVFGGIVDQSSEPELVGTAFTAIVVDDDPDAFFINGSDEPCDEIPLEFAEPIDRGSIHVHVIKE